MPHDTHEPPSTQGVPNGDRDYPRPTRNDNVQPDTEVNASAGKTSAIWPDVLASLDKDEQHRALLQITALLQESHLHVPTLLPPPEEAARLKEQAPELYQAYINKLEAETRAEEISRTAPYVNPAKYTARGQYFGLIAVLSVLLFCGYCVYMGHVVTATIITSFDLVALAAIFIMGKREGTDFNQDTDESQ